jgi:hypothetical protein
MRLPRVAAALWNGSNVATLRDTSGRGSAARTPQLWMCSALGPFRLFFEFFQKRRHTDMNASSRLPPAGADDDISADPKLPLKGAGEPT